jgi:hypothetical protein
MSPVRLLVERSAPVSCLVAALACGAAAGLAPGDALATGMQGHIYMAQCGAEQAQEPRLKALFAAQPLSLANGAFFPDSGYTAPDHDQGEIAHWEQYIQGYLEIIRERYSPPYDDPEAARHVAVMLGAAAHGITDSTFDALLYERSEQVDPGDVDDLDLSMDVFLVAQLKREFVPMVDVDPQTLADVYVQKVPHDVLPAAISKAMTTARSGIAGTIFLAKAPDSFVKRHPWASASFLDARTPGGYPFGAKVVARYHEEILRRLDGDNSAESIVIGTYPSAELPLVTLDSTRPDGRVVLFFGHGLDRDSIDAKTTLVLLGPDRGRGIDLPGRQVAQRADPQARCPLGARGELQGRAEEHHQDPQRRLALEGLRALVHHVHARPRHRRLPPAHRPQTPIGVPAQRRQVRGRRRARGRGRRGGRSCWITGRRRHRRRGQRGCFLGERRRGACSLGGRRACGLGRRGLLGQRGQSQGLRPARAARPRRRDRRDRRSEALARVRFHGACWLRRGPPLRGAERRSHAFGR